MTRTEWAEKNIAAGKVFQFHYPHVVSVLWFNWGHILKYSPASIRPEDWPEPDGWFYGWNREYRKWGPDCVEPVGYEGPHQTIQ